jgi:carbamoyltransferase
MKILGIRFGHDSAAALIVDGKIIADVAEERFTRCKNDTTFPLRAIKYCLEAGGFSSEELDVVATSTRALQPEFGVFFDIPDSVMPQEKNGVKSTVRKLLVGKPNLPVLPRYQKPMKLSEKCRIELVDHHLAHVASAAYTSGIDTSENVLGVTMDGIGDKTSVAVWRVRNNKIENLVRYGGEASLGWFYANSTEAMGWRHGSEEWKVMGLAPYGEPKPGALQGYYPEFKDGVLTRPHDYGDFGRWHDHGANHYHGADSVPMSKVYDELGSENFAAEVQRISEEQAFNVVLPWLEKEQTRHLVCAGGFFLNVKFNQKLWYTGKLDTQWVYPNPGDAGLAVGAALYVHYQDNPNEQHEPLENLYFGPEFNNDEIKTILEDRAIDYSYHENIEEVTAGYLARNLVVGWFQGRMEAGPRALGNRSILMSPLDPANKDLINAKVKYREKFRPFCPSVAAEAYNKYLKGARDELFMVSSFEAKEGMHERIPAVIHEDNSARPQKVYSHINERYHRLITAFGDETGEAILLNTSFNIKGEPIVCNPREAIKCFYDTGLDVLVMGNYLVRKSNIDE